MNQQIKTLDETLSDNERVDLNLSYSRVSDFDRNGPKALLEKSVIDNKGLKMGSIIDDLLFETDNFDEKYHISNFNEPTASLGLLCKIILTNFVKIPSIEVIENIIKINDLWSNIKDSNKLKEKFNNDEFWGYLNDKFKSIDKVVVTKEELEKAKEIVEVLRTHNFSKDLFSSELEQLYQYSFKIKIKQFFFRGIIDIISIDHKNKVIYFKDLKTGAGPSSEFSTSFIKYRYYLQEAVYKQAFNEICNELKLENYTLAPFEFIYIGLNERIPVSYIITPHWSNCALNGFKTTSGYKYKGLYELIDEIYFHWKNQIYDLPMNIYINNGKINLEDNFITQLEREVVLE